MRLLAALVFLLATTVLAQAAAPPLKHDIEVELTPSSGEILIRDRLLVTGRDHYRFRLAPWLDIETLLVDGEPARAQQQGQDFVLKLPDDKQRQLEFSLRGVVPPRDPGQSSAAAMHGSSGSDGVYLPAYDNWIPHHGFESIRYRLQVRLPGSERAVATGKLVGEQSGSEFYQAVFEVDRPAEAPSLFAGPYQVRERRADGLRLRTYFHAELAELSDTYLDAADAFIQRYQDSIGNYPYDDFHIISAPIPVGLGFPNLTYVGRQVIPLPFMRGRSLAHEVLHNWWGNGIGVDYANGNWAEGLTTYLADYALELDKGREAARSMRIKWLRDYAALPASRDQPLRAFVSKRHQAAQVIGYNKAAFMFHMLSLEIGRASFDAGLRLFWERHKYGVAGWRELQAAFEESAGRELDWFFVQWLDRRGAPRLSLGAHRVEQVDDGFRTSVEILQPVSGYRFKLPVLMVSADGRERHEIVVSENLTRVEWVTSSKPRYLHFDPDSDVFRQLQRDETPPILRDVTLNARAAIMIGSADADWVPIARQLAKKLMDVEIDFDRLDLARNFDRPLLLITTHDLLAGQLEQLNLQLPAEVPITSHSAAAWTARLANGNPVLVISARDAAALQTLLRPLPHYGGQSYVLFEAGRATSRGIWPVTQGPLYLDLAGG